MEGNMSRKSRGINEKINTEFYTFCQHNSANLCPNMLYFKDGKNT